jgi:hypothetical protein
MGVFVDTYPGFLVQSELEERFGLLAGQSVSIFRCGRERRFNADRHVFDDR